MSHKANFIFWRTKNQYEGIRSDVYRRVTRQRSFSSPLSTRWRQTIVGGLLILCIFTRPQQQLMTHIYIHDCIWWAQDRTGNAIQMINIKFYRSRSWRRWISFPPPLFRFVWVARKRQKVISKQEATSAVGRNRW